jgi:MFS family permease
VPSIFAALAHREFRLFWAGAAMSVAGRQASMIATAWLLYDITGSALQLGYLGAVRAVPAFLLGLVGGVLADRFDRRKLLVVTTLMSGVIWAGLAALVLTDRVETWHILGVTFLAGAIGAFESPSRHSIFPNLVERRELTNAVALTTAMDPALRIFVPVMAGVLIDRVGSGYTGPAAALFLVTALYTLASSLLMLVHAPEVKRADSGGFRGMVDGAKHLWDDSLVLFLLIMAFLTAIFGVAYTTLLPIFAYEISSDSSGSVLGLFYSVGGVGGLLGALLTGTGRVTGRPGRFIVLTSVLFGAGLIGFALSPWFALSLALLFTASFANNAFSVAAQSILQSRLADDFRGRVMGFWGMQHSVLHSLGSLEMGGLASLIGAAGAVIVGGVVVIGFAVFVAAPNRELRSLSMHGPGRSTEASR